MLSTYAQHTEDVGSADSLTLWTGFNLEMKEVHLCEQFPSFPFLVLLLFALPKVVSFQAWNCCCEGDSSQQLCSWGAKMKWRDFKWILNADAVEELQHLERDSYYRPSALGFRRDFTQCEPLLSTYLEFYRSADSLHLAFWKSEIPAEFMLVRLIC